MSPKKIREMDVDGVLRKGLMAANVKPSDASEESAAIANKTTLKSTVAFGKSLPLVNSDHFRTRALNVKVLKAIKKPALALTVPIVVIETFDDIPDEIRLLLRLKHYV